MIANRLVIMAKAPMLGRVKTRLGREVGLVEATRCYRAMLWALVRRLGSDPRWQTWLAVAPDSAAAHAAWPPGVGVLGQGGGDLGCRMQRLFDRMPPGPVLIVGSDIPDIARRDIAEGFRALGANDAVFGPACDGGYWLVGQRRRPRIVRMFEGVRWSGPHALEDTLANLEGLRVARLRMLEDVDDMESYRRWRRQPLARFRCSSSRGMISTKLHGM
ncbi:TIGR04282 family arsenosugar biosynthesis glycosyltransferase [Kaustia mangrovi]|nr:TIGR04282 family arsenosugar biosynthesis glycosyltransferase [Kaustia mangrovi]